MDKEEILAKSRQENPYQDERDKIISVQASTCGAIGMAVLFVVLHVIQMFKGGTSYDLLSMFFSYLAAINIYKYKLLKGKKEIISAIMYSIITFVWLVLYIWKG